MAQPPERACPQTQILTVLRLRIPRRSVASLISCYLQRSPKLLAKRRRLGLRGIIPVGTHSNVFCTTGRNKASIVKASLQSVVLWLQQSFLVPSAFIATIILKSRVGWQSPKKVKLKE